MVPGVWVRRAFLSRTGWIVVGSSVAVLALIIFLFAITGRSGASSATSGGGANPRGSATGSEGGSGDPTRPGPVPIMPNPVPASVANAATGSAGAPAGSPSGRAAPAAMPANTPAPTGESRDFVSIAEQVAGTSPEARAILIRHGRELQSLVDGYASPARAFLAVLDAPATVDPSVLRQRVSAVHAMNHAATRYIDSAKSIQERLEADLRADPRVDKDAVASISARYIAQSFATGRIFAMEQAIRAGDDLIRQSQLILDSPSSWSLDANGRVTTSDMTKANEYRMYETKLSAPKGAIRSAVERAISP